MRRLPKLPLLKISLLNVLLVAAGACSTGGGADAGDDGDAGADPIAEAEADTLAAVATYDTAGFSRVTAMHLPTTHAASSHGQVWITTPQADAYKAIDPEAAGADGGPAFEDFPFGTIILKQQVDADGNEASGGRLLVMSKFPEGYAPETNDWWWALFNNKDSVSGDRGQVGFCIGCHTEFSDTDWVEGVAAANQQ